MDVEDEIAWLKAETLALQAILVGLCRSLNARPDTKPFVDEAFGHADTFIHAGAVQFGKPEQTKHFRTAASIIEQLRMGAQGKSQPKKDV